MKKGEKKALARNKSIIDFYNQNAGLQTISGVELDEHKNPKGSEFDLGRDDAFTQFKVLIGKFFQIKTDIDKQNMKDHALEQPKAALKAKGFQVEIVDNEKEFLEKLVEADVAWILSAHEFITKDTDVQAKFLDTVVEYHNSGGGLFIWAENDPFYFHANLILQKLLNVKVSGNDPAKLDLTLGDSSTKGHFGGHLVTTGLNHLFEGDSVSFIEDTKSITDKLEIIATSSGGHPVLFAGNTATFDKHAGRIFVDCGFTKLFMHWDTAGTARYVKNACVWLLGLDHRIASDAPLRGKVVKKQTDEWIWQYNHGNSWHNYDSEAAKVVEAIYLGYIQDPGVDIRSVKSGDWSYMLDFGKMTQTNVEHHNHTTRNIRRLRADASENSAHYL